jgi:hypothetical protein
MAAAKKKKGLGAELDELARSIGISAKEKPAGVDATLERLRDGLGKALPDDLRAWFGWIEHHVDRRELHEFRFQETWTPITAEQALAVWSTLGESANKPWEKTWVPLFANGIGDYLISDIASGALDGKLLVYWHNGAGRPPYAKSLEAWASQRRRLLRARAKRKAIVLGPIGTTWTPITPAEARKGLADRPVGTAFGSKIAGFTNMYTVRVKIGPNEWYVDCSGRDLVRSVKGMQNRIDEDKIPKVPDSAVLEEDLPHPDLVEGTVGVTVP